MKAAATKKYNFPADDPARWRSLRRPNRPVIEWLLAKAETALAAAVAPEKVATAFFGAGPADLHDSIFAMVLRHHCRGRRDLPLVREMLQ